MKTEEIEKFKEGTLEKPTYCKKVSFNYETLAVDVHLFKFIKVFQSKKSFNDGKKDFVYDYVYMENLDTGEIVRVSENNLEYHGYTYTHKDFIKEYKYQVREGIKKLKDELKRTLLDIEITEKDLIDLKNNLKFINKNIDVLKRELDYVSKGH